MAEKEYIEREALLNEIEEIRPLNWADTEAEITEQADFDWFENLVKSQTAADVQEVRHGKWVDNAEDVYWKNHFIRKYCSECGNEPEYRAENYSYVLSNYCRNCGAKMDKE